MNALQSDFYSQKFDSIQMLRGIAALFVAFSHFAFIGVGSFGVDIFFCISGFIMMYVTSKGCPHFISKRLIRILPLYYLMTVFSFLLVFVFPSMFETTDANPLYILKSCLFIPYEIDGVIQPIVRVGWTINYEMFFYLIFFLCCKISQKYRGLICSVLLIVMAAVGEFVDFSFIPFEFWANELLLEFAGGILAFYLAQLIFGYFKSKKEDMPAIHKALVSILLILTIFTGFCFIIWGQNLFILTHFSRVIKWGLPAFIIFLAAFTLGCLVKIPRFLVFLGDISFSVYLIHYYPISFLSRWAEKYGSTLINLIVAVCGTALVIFAAYICHILIEVKLTNFLKRHLKI